MDVATQIMFIIMAIVAEQLLEEFAKAFWDLREKWDEIDIDKI
jgi:hypothetical protein